MKQSIIYYPLILLACLSLGACSSNDVDNNNEVKTAENYTYSSVEAPPSWTIDWTYDQNRPDWQAPNNSNYENWSVMIAEIEETLRPTTSLEDMLAVFDGDELCGLAQPAVNINNESDEDTPFRYVIKVYNNDEDETQQNLTLRYYSDSLHQLFTIPKNIDYGDDGVFGINESRVLEFTKGSSKYPVTMILTVNVVGIEGAGGTPAEGDMLAAFCEDECRASSTLGSWAPSQPLSLNVFGRETGEQITIKYYSMATQRIYTFNNSVKITGVDQTVNLNFQ